MAAKKKRSPRKAPHARQQNEGESRMPGKRLRRTDDEKIQLVRQVLASDNQSAEIKRLGIYPNQFYDWKKKFAGQVGGSGGGSSRGAAAGRGSRGRDVAINAARTVADEAKAFIQGKAKLLERLRAQRSELDELIAQLEG